MSYKSDQGEDWDRCPDVSRISVKIEHAAVQASTQPWIEMECYQLSPGKQLAQMETLDLGGQQVVRESQVAAVQKLGITPPDLCTVSCCTPNPNARFSEIVMHDDKTIFFMPENTEFDIYVPPGAQTSYVSFSQQAFLAGARALDPEGWECAPQQVVTIQTAQQAALTDAVTMGLSSADAIIAPTASSGSPSALNDHLLHNILLLATASVSDHFSLSRAERAHAYHICRRARILVDECLAVDRVPSVVELCMALDVSERTLQYAFRAYVNMSPLAYLRLCRLNRVHDTLLTADPRTTSVTVVAIRFGFFHLGRFAADYNRLFNASASETLTLQID